MKVTAKIKNLKDHIIGYFSKESGEFSDILIGFTDGGGNDSSISDIKFLDKLGNNPSVFDFCPAKYNYVFIHMYSPNYKNIYFSKNLKNKFRFVLVAKNGAPIQIITGASGNKTAIVGYGNLYEYTPTNWNDLEIHSDTIYKKVGELKQLNGSDADRVYDIYDSFPRNDI